METRAPAAAMKDLPRGEGGGAPPSPPSTHLKVRDQRAANGEGDGGCVSEKGEGGGVFHGEEWAS